jgi:DegV family protein with EDD domain
MGAEGLKEKIALIVDSMCDLPQEIIQKFAIKVLPAKIIYPGEEYADGVDIQPDEVYRRMPDEIPTTAMPTRHEISEAFEQIHREGFTHVLALHISSGLSGTVESVKMVARDFENLKIDVLDTKTLSMGTGWMVLDAARNIANGLCFERVLESLQSIQPKVEVYYIIETLEYLRRGGRIGRVAGMLGQFLHVKPIISVDREGNYFTYCKARGRLKSIDKLLEIVENKVKEKQIKLAVLNGGASQEFEKLVERLRQLPNIKELVTSDISPALCVHTGPGLLGISFYEV